jgi:hypothetical protein
MITMKMISITASYNHERGVLLGYDKCFGKMGVETVTRKTVEILSVHPSNVRQGTSCPA